MRRLLFVLCALALFAAPLSAQVTITPSPYINGAGVARGSIIAPASSYWNFGVTTGETGYGFRDNSGTMEFKNSGGSWTPTATDSNYWARTGTVVSPATATDQLVVGASALHSDVTLGGAKSISSWIASTTLGNFIAENSTVGAAYPARFYGYKGRAADGSADTALTNGDDILSLAGYGADGAAYQAAGKLLLEAAGTPSSGVVPGRWYFQTANASGVMVTALQIEPTNALFFGGATYADYTQFKFGGAFASGGSSSVAYGSLFGSAITAAAGDTSRVSQVAIQTGSITTAGASEVYGLLSSLYLTEPNIVLGTGDSASIAATLAIGDAPTEGTYNYSLFNDSTALSRFDGSIVVGNVSLSTHMTTGISLRQGAADDEILSFHSTDVAHGMTAIADTDAFGCISKRDAAQGGLRVAGFGEISRGIQLAAYVTSEDSTRSNGGVAAITLDGYLKSDTTAGNMSAGANLVAIRNGSAGSVWIAGTTGNSWQSGIATMLGAIFGTGNPTVEGSTRVNCTGTTPSRTCSVLIYDGGAVRTVATSAAF
jgi:hypothetical protein